VGKHYVPRAYLTGFAEPGSPEFVWVYRKGTDECFRTNVINVAQEGDYYPDPVENYLALEIEEPANAVLLKLHRRDEIDPNDRMALARYIVVQMKRVPRHRERIDGWVPEYFEKTFDRLEQELTLTIAAKHPKAAILTERLKQVQELRPQYQKELPDGSIAPGGHQPSPSIQIQKRLGEVSWRTP
jgi:hypothetical protein